MWVDTARRATLCACLCAHVSLGYPCSTTRPCVRWTHTLSAAHVHFSVYVQWSLFLYRYIPKISSLLNRICPSISSAVLRFGFSLQVVPLQLPTVSVARGNLDWLGSFCYIVRYPILCSIYSTKVHYFVHSCYLLTSPVLPNLKFKIYNVASKVKT